MNRTTTNIYRFALSCLMLGSATAMDVFEVAYSLLPPKPESTKPIKAKKSRNEAEYLANTVNFRAEVDNMINHFENFSAMNPEKQQEVLKTWRKLAECCCSELQLSKSGYNVGFEISDETTHKLAAIQVIYRNHRKHKKIGRGCILQ